METITIQTILEKTGRSWGGLLGHETAADRIRRLAAEADGAVLLEEARKAAETYSGLPIPQTTYSLFRLFGETGSRLEFERVYFEKRKRLNAFAIMTLAEPGRTDNADRLCDIIWSICDEHTWCVPAHVGGKPESTGEGPEESAGDYDWMLERWRSTTIDLFAAETAFALAEVTSMLEGVLPEAVAKRVRSEVYRRVLWPYLNGGPYGWETSTHNWSAVCAGSIGCAAMYLVENEEELARILAKTLRSMGYYLSGFEDDGACKEGLGYWKYGFGFYVYYADLLKRRTGGEIDLFRDLKVHQIALFQQKCFLGGSAVANFSDSSALIGVNMGLTHYLHRTYGDVELPSGSLRARFGDDHCGRWGPEIRNLLWLNEGGLAGGSWQDAAYYLPDAQWLISRHGGYGFAAKGGDNDEPHNHNDVGHFMLHAGGSGYLIDLGYGEYTKEYFGERRYEFDCNGAHGHSVPIVDGRLQQPGKAFRARDVRASVGALADRMELELADAYGYALLVSLRRRLEWVKSDEPELRLEDTFVFEERPGSVVERFVSAFPASVSGAGKLVVQGSRSLAVFYDAELWEPLTDAVTYRDHYGKEQTYYRIDFHGKQAALGEQVTGRFAFRFEAADSSL